nr:hypothetical protein [Butyrivibrio sp. MC2013]
MDERIKKQLDFALEIDKEKNVFRQTSLSGGGRKENDAKAVYGRHEGTRPGSEILYNIADEIIKKHIKKGNLAD